MDKGSCQIVPVADISWGSPNQYAFAKLIELPWKTQGAPVAKTLPFRHHLFALELN